jgi:uncharacterized membrane protein
MATALMGDFEGRRIGWGRVLGWVGLAAGVAALDAIAALRLGRLTRETAAEEAGPAIPVEHSIVVNCPPAACYQYWRAFENLPRFMWHVQSVSVSDYRRSHWVVKVPAGKVEWDADIVDDRPDERIEWRSVEGADLESRGEVRFEPDPAGRGTIVHVRLRYRPPAGRLGATFARLFHEDPGSQLKEDLRRFKQILETGEIATTRGQPSGRRGLIARQLRSGGES